MEKDFLFFVLSIFASILLLLQNQKKIMAKDKEEIVRLEVIGLSKHNRPDAYILVLGAVNGNEKLPIIIGLPEAQSIAVRIENVATNRPLTHDVIVSMATAFDIVLKRVIVYKYDSGIFYSKLVCRRGEETIDIDSRTSDAVALALRFSCPIYAYRSVITTVMGGGTSSGEEPVAARKREPVDLTKLTNTELNEMMKAAIASEEYETASKIKAILDSRKGL